MSDIRFNQWLHQSGTGGVSQVASGAVGVGTTNPLADFYVRGDAQITGILTAGHIAMGSSITFGDDDRAYFGDGTDLQIYHSGSHSFIQDTGTGNLFIDSNSVQIRNAVASKTTAKFIENAQVELYYNNTERIRTTNTGAFVTGILTATSFVGGLPIAGGANDRVITASSASAIQGEANLTFNGSKLHLAANSTAYDAFQVGDGLFIGNTTNNISAAIFHQGGGADLEIGAQDMITFTTGSTAGNATERLRITSNGNTIISAPNAVAQTPVAILDVFNQGSTRQALRVYRNDLNDNTLAAFESYHNALGIVPKMVITSRGRVGVNTDNPQREIHVKPWDNNPATAVPGYIRIEGQGSDQPGILELYHTRGNGSDKWPSSVASVDGGLTLNVANGNNGAPQEKVRITSAGFVQIGAAADAAEAPLHVTAENSQGINAIFGAKDFVVSNNYNYADANIALQGRDADDNDTGAGIQFTVRNTANTNWLHGAITMDVSGNYIFKNGGAGTTVGTEKLRITSGGKVNIGGDYTNTTSTLRVIGDSNAGSQTYLEKSSGSTNNTYNSVLTLSSRSTGSAAANYGPGITFQHAFGGANYAGCLITSQCNSDVNTADLVFYPRNYGFTEALRIKSNGQVDIAGQIHKRQDTTNRTALKTYSGEGLWFDHYQYQYSGTYRRYADIVSAGDGSWGSYMRFFTMKDSGTPTERLRIQKDGGVYMRTQGGFTNEAGNLSSGVGYDNRTRLYPYWISETGACRFHFSATANPGISQPRFWLFTNGTNHLAGKVQITMNTRTNSPSNAQFRYHHSTWQVGMYGEGDNDGSSMRYIHLEGTQRGSTTISTFDEYYVSSNGHSQYGTNDNQYQDGYGGWHWKMDGGSGVQAHRFHFDCYFSGGGFSTWYMYIDQ